MRFIAITVVFLSAVASHGFCDEEERQLEFVKIPRQTLKILTQQAVPLLKAGNKEAATDLIMVILGKADPKLVNSIDKLLVDQGLPASSVLFTDRVLRRVEAGLVDMSKSPTTIELRMLLPELVSRTKSVVAAARSHERVKGKEKLPVDWNEAEVFFWDFHVMKNELESTIRLGEFGVQISKRFLSPQQKDENVELADTMQEQVPDYQRRHYYTWPIGHQDIVVSSSSNTNRTRNYDFVDTTTLNRFY